MEKEDVNLFLEVYRGFVLQYWGERCDDFDPECHCCKAWRRYEDEKAACDYACN